MQLSNYPSGFKNGVTVRGVPITQDVPGKVFWVSNSGVLVEGEKTGSNGNKGDRLHPFATIDYAIGQCKAGRGDVILVKPGHVETIATASAVNFDVDGVTCIGLGRGSKMARFDVTATGGFVDVVAKNVTIENMNFHANVTAVTKSSRTSSTGTVIRGCLFDVETTGTDEFAETFVLKSGAGDFLMEDCVIDMGIGSSSAGVKFNTAVAGATIRRNRIVGNHSSAIIFSDANVCTEVYIEDNLFINGASGDIHTEPVIEMASGSTGVVRNNTQLCNVATIAAQTVADTMFFSRNFAGEDVGAAAGNILRTAAASVTASADD